MKNNYFIGTLLLLLSLNSKAQETTQVKTRKAQITFAYPLGSSGMKSMNYTNKFSLNMLYGLNGGVSGLELGSIFNYNRGSVRGAQLSGVMNINTGSTKGIIVSGLANIGGESTNGVLLSGVLNHSKGNTKGAEIATVNIAAKEFNGLQLGVINYARKMKGLQFGVINIVKDSAMGIPIGLFSVVKKGYFELEACAGEVLLANLNYKMGIERFYTIYKLGYGTYKNNPVYSLGLGFGGNISLAKKQKLSIDVTSNQINYDEKWDGDLNLLNKLDVNYKHQISKNLSAFVGPSLNVYVTKEKVDNKYGTLNIPYTLFTDEWVKGKLFTWVGLNVGMAIKL